MSRQQQEHEEQAWREWEAAHHPESYARLLRLEAIERAQQQWPESAKRREAGGLDNGTDGK